MADNESQVVFVALIAATGSQYIVTRRDLLPEILGVAAFAMLDAREISLEEMKAVEGILPERLEGAIALVDGGTVANYGLVPLRSPLLGALTTAVHQAKTIKEFDAGDKGDKKIH